MVAGGLTKKGLASRIVRQIGKAYVARTQMRLDGRKGRGAEKRKEKG